jgi:hypothetical protein
VNLSENLTSHGEDDGLLGDFHKDSLSKLFGVQEIYPEDHGASADSPSLTDFLAKYKNVSNLC